MSNTATYQDDNAIITEIINGREVQIRRCPSLAHNVTAGNILCQFAAYLRGKDRACFHGLAAELDASNIFFPDVIIADKSQIQYDCIHGAPDLVVEVLSPSTAANDRGIKKDTYEKAGVKEYWIVDPVSKSIDVHHLKEGKFVLDHVYTVYPDWEWERMTEEQRAAARLTVKVSLYDDLLVDAREVFEDLE